VTKVDRTPMSYRCYGDIKTQASAWKVALAAVEWRAEDLEKPFAEEPGKLLLAACGSPYYPGLANAALWRELAAVYHLA
jgi:hypothetical protein